MLKAEAGAKHFCTYILLVNAIFRMKLHYDIKCYFIFIFIFSFISYTFIKCIKKFVLSLVLPSLLVIFSYLTCCSFSSNTLSFTFLHYDYFCENEITYNILWDYLRKQTTIKPLSLLFQPLLVLCFTLLGMFLNNE